MHPHKPDRVYQPLARERASLLSPETHVRDLLRHNKKRMKGFEPSTFAMARRRSSQLSYIRTIRPF
jgi:hypothetical protein